MGASRILPGVYVCDVKQTSFPFDPKTLVFSNNVAPGVYWITKKNQEPIPILPLKEIKNLDPIVKAKVIPPIKEKTYVVPFPKHLEKMYHTPKNFSRFLAEILPNVEYFLKSKKFPPDAIPDFETEFTIFFMGTAKGKTRPRYQDYDPTRNVSYSQWFFVQLRFFMKTTATKNYKAKKKNKIPPLAITSEDPSDIRDYNVISEEVLSGKTDPIDSLLAIKQFEDCLRKGQEIPCNSDKTTVRFRHHAPELLGVLAAKGSKSKFAKQVGVKNTTITTWTKNLQKIAKIHLLTLEDAYAM